MQAQGRPVGLLFRGEGVVQTRTGPDTGRTQQKRRALLLGRVRNGFPAPPSYTFELNVLLGAPPIDLKRVAHVIGSDPTLMVQVLKVCNALGRGWQRPVASIDEAVIMLGTDRLRALVLTCPLIEYSAQWMLFHQIQAFWQHNFMTALLSERIARWTAHPLPEHAYLAGLLHSIGTLPLVAVWSTNRNTGDTPDLEELLASRENERAYFGSTHCEVGRLIAATWNLPASLAEVLEHHHEPAKASYDPRLVGLVAAAHQLCSRHGLAWGGRPVSGEVAGPRDDAEILRACVPGVDISQSKRLADSVGREITDLLQVAEFCPSRAFHQRILAG